MSMIISGKWRLNWTMPWKPFGCLHSPVAFIPRIPSEYPMTKSRKQWRTPFWQKIGAEDSNINQKSQEWQRQWKRQYSRATNVLSNLLLVVPKTILSRVVTQPFLMLAFVWKILLDEVFDPLWWLGGLCRLLTGTVKPAAKSYEMVKCLKNFRVCCGKSRSFFTKKCVTNKSTKDDKENIATGNYYYQWWVQTTKLLAGSSKLEAPDLHRPQCHVRHESNIVEIKRVYG